jgi:hypothetical protein
VPTLKTFTSRFQGLPISGGRAASGADFGAEEAKATGELARTAAKVGEGALQNVEETEARRALVGTTEIRAKYARELDAAVQSGQDTQELKIKLDADLAKVGEEFQTSKGKASLDMHSANTHLMFDEQANRIEVQRAAATARLEGAKYMQASSAILIQNPLALQEREQGVDDLMSTFKRIPPHERAEMAQKLKQNLNMTAALGMTRIEPEGTKRKLENGEWNLTAEQRETAIHSAEREISGRRSAEAYARQVAELERKNQDDIAQAEHFANIREGRGSWVAMRDDARLMPHTREALTKYMDQRSQDIANGVKKSDQAVLNRLWIGVNAPDHDPRKFIHVDPIIKAVTSGQINTSDGNMLLAAVKSQKDENATRISSTLYTMTSNFQRSLEQSPKFWGLKFEGEAPAVVNEFNAIANEKISAARVANDVAALRELFNPNSKTFLGSKRTMDEAVQRVNARKQDELRAEALATLPLVETQAQYDALAPGAQFRNSRDEIGVKPQPSGRVTGTIRTE